MNIMREKVKDLVISSVIEMNDGLSEPLPVESGEECKLYRFDSHLDSISLVMLISEVEAKIEDEFNITLTLASAKAMSGRNSPFSTIGRLTDYTMELITESENA